MINIAKKLIKRETGELYIVFGEEEVRDLERSLQTRINCNVDEDYGSIIYKYEDRLFGDTVVNIVREWLYNKGEEEVEDMDSEELNDYVNSNYSRLFWEC